MKNLRIAVGVFLLFITSAFSQDLRMDMYYSNKDFILLREIDIFYAISFDENGNFYDANLAFFRLLKHSNARDYFRHLLVEAKNIEGKIYGLAGLYYHDEIEEYFIEGNKINNEIVTISVGDVIARKKVFRLMEDIESGILFDSLFWCVDFKKIEILTDCQP